jgi:hypothetical protein
MGNSDNHGVLAPLGVEQHCPQVGHRGAVCIIFNAYHAFL